MGILLLALVPLAGCGAEDSDALPPCPKVTPSPVMVPGLAGRIAYSSLNGGGGHCSGIIVMNADGSGRHRITPPELHLFDPTWSPDGSHLAFTGACAEPLKLQLCVIAADGTGLRALTHHPGYSAYPAWSPDGRRIAFSRTEESLGPHDLYIVDADGTAEVRLTSAPSDEREPSWSPDGKTLVYVASEGTRQLRLLRLDAGTSTSLARGGTLNESPVFSHDGRRIAFHSNRTDKADSALGREMREAPGGRLLPPSNGAPDIYVVGVDGQGLTRLTHGDAANYSPQWSPDDRHIVFVSDRDGRQEVYVMAADGSDQRRLTHHPEDGASSASWTR